MRPPFYYPDTAHISETAAWVLWAIIIVALALLTTFTLGIG
jgi:hypothetical protein